MQELAFITDPLLAFIPRIPELIFYILIGYLVIQIIIWSLEKIISLTKLPQLKGIVLIMAKLSLWVVFVILISNTFGFNRLAVAISGTAIVLVFFLNTGLAPLITDAISGVFLCTDPDFVLGSRVRIGKGENATEGKISEIDVRKVRITADDGSVHIIPNSVVDKDEWVVLDKPANLKVKASQAREVIKNKLKNRRNKS